MSANLDRLIVHNNKPSFKMSPLLTVFHKLTTRLLLIFQNKKTDEKTKAKNATV